jgi:hypothetical protein
MKITFAMLLPEIFKVFVALLIVTIVWFISELEDMGRVRREYYEKGKKMEEQ